MPFGKLNIIANSPTIHSMKRLATILAATTQQLAYDADTLKSVKER